MIDAIGANAAYAYQSAGAGSASSLAQTEQQLFAAIDSNGDGTISQSELTSFMSQLGAASGTSATSAAGASQPVNASTLYSALDTSGGSGISLQDFENNIGTLANALRSQLAAAQSTAAGSAAGAAAATTSATSGSAASSGAGATQHHGHHGHHGGGGAQALAASLLQQIQASGATAATGAQSTLNTTA